MLPSGRAHVFKKHGGGWQLGLMFSITGDESYVGATALSFVRHFLMLCEAEDVAAAAAKATSGKGKSYSLCDLVLLQLGLDGA